MNNRITGIMLKKDEPDREPDIYILFIITAIFVLIFGILIYTGAGAAVLGGFLIAYLALMLILLGLFSYLQVQCNPYSCNIIYYRGFLLFFLVLLFTTIQYCKGIFRVPDAFTYYDIVWFLTDSAITYLYMSVIPIIIFSVWLCISNICLIRHEGKRRTNVLGILLALVMTGTLLLLIWFGVMHDGWIPRRFHIAASLVINLFAVIYLYFQCMLIGSFAAVFTVAFYEPPMDRDFIVIRGCRIRRDGTPTPLLRGRIDRAVAFYTEQKEKTGTAPVFVTSGGRGSDEVTSESASMKAYLLEQGIPQEQIIEEDRSVNTYQNMLFSKEKIDAVRPDAKVAFSTTNYHVFRSGLYARRVGLKASGMGQPTKWWFWPNATVRECVGLMTENKRIQALILGSFVVICTILTWLSFS